MIVLRFVFLGPPGAGKGTQAVRLAEDLLLPHISTGDILRHAVREGTDLGREAKRAMDAGELVPDEIVAGLVAERIRNADCRGGFILDGFPRTLAQAEILEEKTSDEPMRVVSFELSEQEAVERLTGRRTCPECGASYHIRNLPPLVQGVCDRCGAQLIQRSDDQEETVRERLRIYREQTGDLVRYYQERGSLVTVSADGSPDKVYEELRIAARQLG